MPTLELYSILPTDAPATVILKAAHFAAVKHRSQLRKDGNTPYINHPIGVATLLAVEGQVTDIDVLAAAVLHDTVEDTDCSSQEIHDHFGPRVAKFVAEVTDDKQLPSAECKRLQIVKAHLISSQAQQLKLADKLYNLRDLTRRVPDGWTSTRVQEYFAWSKQVTDACSHANPRLAQLLNDLYQHGHFDFQGTTYKCLVTSTTPS